MKRNTSSEFVGIAQIKAKQKWQLDQFEAWVAAGQWNMFHRSHYDWWMFPVNRKSSYGLTWTVYDGDIQELKTDDRYITTYLRGIELVSASWGWDVVRQCAISEPMPDQAWQSWPVRLYKAANSTRLFGFDAYFDSLKHFALDLMQQGESMTYAGKDLSWLFTSGSTRSTRS